MNGSSSKQLSKRPAKKVLMTDSLVNISEDDRLAEMECVEVDLLARQVLGAPSCGTPPKRIEGPTYTTEAQDIEISLDQAVALKKKSKPMVRRFSQTKLLKEHLHCSGSTSDTKTLSTTGSTATHPTKASSGSSNSDAQKKKSFRDRFMRKSTESAPARDENAPNASTRSTSSTSKDSLRQVSILGSPHTRVPEQRGRSRSLERTAQRSRSKSRGRGLAVLMCRSKAVDLEYEQQQRRLEEQQQTERPFQFKPVHETTSRSPHSFDPSPMSYQISRVNQQKYVSPSTLVGKRQWGPRPRSISPPSVCRSPLPPPKPNQPETPVQQEQDKYAERKPSTIALNRRVESHVSELSVEGLERQQSSSSVATIRQTLRQVEEELQTAERQGRSMSREDVLKTLKAVAKDLESRHQSVDRRKHAGRRKMDKAHRLESWAEGGSEEESESSSEEHVDTSADDISEFTRWIEELEDGEDKEDSSFLADLFNYSLLSGTREEAKTKGKKSIPKIDPPKRSPSRERRRAFLEEQERQARHSPHYSYYDYPAPAYHYGPPPTHYRYEYHPPPAAPYADGDRPWYHDGPPHGSYAPPPTHPPSGYYPPSQRSPSPAPYYHPQPRPVQHMTASQPEDVLSVSSIESFAYKNGQSQRRVRNDGGYGSERLLADDNSRGRGRDQEPRRRSKSVGQSAYNGRRRDEHSHYEV